MRKVYIVLALTFGALAVLFVLAGIISVGSPFYHELGPWSVDMTPNYGGDNEADANTIAHMLPYLSGQVLGVGLTCAGLTLL